MNWNEVGEPKGGAAGQVCRYSFDRGLGFSYPCVDRPSHGVGFPVMTIEDFYIAEELETVADWAEPQPAPTPGDFRDYGMIATGEGHLCFPSNVNQFREEALQVELRPNVKLCRSAVQTDGPGRATSCGLHWRKFPQLIWAWWLLCRHGSQPLAFFRLVASSL